MLLFLALFYLNFPLTCRFITVPYSECCCCCPLYGDAKIRSSSGSASGEAICTNCGGNVHQSVREVAVVEVLLSLPPLLLLPSKPWSWSWSWWQRWSVGRRQCLRCECLRLLQELAVSGSASTSGWLLLVSLSSLARSLTFSASDLLHYVPLCLTSHCSLTDCTATIIAFIAPIRCGHRFGCLFNCCCCCCCRCYCY